MVYPLQANLQRKVNISIEYIIFMLLIVLIQTKITAQDNMLIRNSLCQESNLHSTHIVVT